MAAVSYSRDSANSWNCVKVKNLCSDREQMMSFLQDLGLLAKKYGCPICNMDMHLGKRKDISDGLQWNCRGNSTNRHNVGRSIRKGTWFENSNLSIPEIIELTYYWVEEYPQSIVMREGNFGSHTVVDWYNFCREICTKILEKACRKIGGVGHTVEVDESLFSERKYHRGKWVKEKWVFGGIDRETRECFLQIVDDRSRDTLVHIVKERVIPGTTICSNSWKACSSLRDEGYPRSTINHSKTFKDSATGCHTKNIEDIWHLVKRKAPSTIKQKDVMYSYLNSYLYRQWRGTGDLHDNHRLICFLRDVAMVCQPQTFDV